MALIVDAGPLYAYVDADDATTTPHLNFSKHIRGRWSSRHS